MLLTKKPTVAVIVSDTYEQESISKLLSPITDSILFLQDIHTHLFDREPPEIIIVCPHSNAPYFTDQIHFFRNDNLLNKTPIIVVEKEIQSAKVQSYIEAGCDFVLPYKQLHQLPIVVDIFSDLSQYRMLQSLSHWKQIFNRFHQPIFICDENVSIFLANERASSLLQNQQQTMQGLSLQDYLLPKQARDIQKKVWECIKRKTSYQNLQISLRTFSHEFIPCSLSIQWLGALTKSKTGVLLLFQENSEIESIKLKSFLLQSVLDKSSSSILITNAQGTIFYANPSLLKRIHQAPSNVLSRSSEELSEEYHLHKREDALPYITLGFTYFHENDYLDPNGNHVHEREKILPILYNAEKKEGFLIRITEYMKQNPKQNEKHNQWFQELLEKASAQISSLHNSANLPNKPLGLQGHEQMRLFHKTLRSLKIVQEFYDTKTASHFSFDCVSLNELIVDVANLFPEYSHLITFRLQNNISKILIQKDKLHFVLMTLLETIFEQFNEPGINLNTSTHQKNILFVLRVLPKEPSIEDPRSYLLTMFEEELWIVKQILTTLSMEFKIHNEFHGGFSFFFTIPSINDNMGYKEPGISELL